MLFGGAVAAGDRDPGAEEGSAGGRFGRFDGAAVGGRDGADDRQAEAGAGPAGGVGGAFATDEAVEDLGSHRGRDARPVVGDFDHRVVALFGEFEFDRRALGGVAGGVVEQV